MMSRRVPLNSSRMLSRRALSAAVLVALSGAPLFASAQVTPDANAGAHRPGTDTAANGTPVVNIVAPSAAGVSHNQYQQFNVDKPGLILNNNAGVSPTQQAGYIAGNPNYQAGQSAKVIVNEVTSSNPTHLRGYTEVAGNAADVIIANPNGISVDGGGFINTNRATLTTGIPVFGGDGSLSAFHTTRGSISIDGEGLNTSNIDRLDLIARNLAVNGKVWANNLNVATGANQVGYADLSAQAIAGEGAAPAVGVDVAALGGMYANKIMLIGTEAGVGVRNAGQLATQSGDFTITSAGQLQLTGATSSAGNFTINAASLSNSGALQSGGAMNVQAASNVDNGGTLLSGHALTIQADALNNSGALQSTSGTNVQTSGDVANSGTIYSGGDVNLTAGGVLSNSNLIAAANNASLRAQQVASSGTLGAGIATDGSVQGGGALDITAAGTLAANGRNLAASTLRLQGTVLDLAGSQTQSNGDISLTAVSGDIAHNNAALATPGTLTINAAGAVDNSHASVQAGQLSAQAAAWRNAYGTVQTSGAMTAQLGGLLDNTQGQWISATNAALRAGSITNGDGALYAAGNLSLDSTGLLQTSGTVYGGQSLNLHAGQLEQRGTLYSDGAQSLDVDGDATLGGTVYAGQSLNLHAGQLTQSGTLSSDGAQNVRVDGNAALSGTAFAGGASQWQVGGALANTGMLVAQGDLILAAGQLSSSGTLRSDGAQAIHVDGDAMLAGTTYAGGAAQWQVGGMLTSRGTLAAQSDLTLAAGQLASTGTLAAGLQADGSLVGSAHLNVDTQGALVATGQNAASGGMTLTGQALDLHGATTRAGGDIALVARQGGIDHSHADLATNGRLSIQAAQAFANTQGRLQAGQLNLQAGSVSNQSGQLLQTGAGDTMLIIGGQLDNDSGTIASNADNLTISASSIDNTSGAIEHAGKGMLAVTTGALTNAQGRIVGNGDLLLTGANTNNDGGTLSVASNAELSGTDFSNVGGTLVANALQATFDGTFSNLHGLLQANRARIAAQALTNGDGQIKTLTGDLDMTVAQTLSNDAAGFLGSNHGVNLSAGRVSNAGQIYAGTDLALTTQGDVTNSGALQALGKPPRSSPPMTW